MPAEAPLSPESHGAYRTTRPTLIRWPSTALADLGTAECPVVVFPEGVWTDPIALIAAGARAVIGDDEHEWEAARAAVEAGGSYLSPAVLARIGGGQDDEKTEETAAVRLGPREVETLRCIVSGLTHRQAARQLGVTEQTVNTYAKRLRRKLGAANKADLTRRAVELGYVPM